MDDLVQFLRARLDDDEQAAKAAKPGPWHADGGSVYATHPTDEVVDYTESAAHIARHDPVRLLADIDAKREVVQLHEDSTTALMAASGTILAGGVKVRRRAYEDVLKLLALPYADHPDYREDWRP